MVFLDAHFFWLLALIPFWVYWVLKKNNPKQPSLRSSGLDSSLFGGHKARLIYLPFLLQILAFVLLTCALARPQRFAVQAQADTTNGIDIVLAIDVSSSMRTEDLSPNRLEAAKSSAISFVNLCQNDRIGLVIFAGEAFGQIPLTTNHFLVIDAIRNLNFELIMDGTAIGVGLGTAVTKLTNPNVKTKVVILLTDGIDNGYAISPSQATQLAADNQVRVYTIGVGGVGASTTTQKNIYGDDVTKTTQSNIDEDLLKTIALRTNGRYFRAQNTQELLNVYAEIDALEKSKLPTKKYTSTTELYRYFALPAFFLMLVSLLLPYIYLKKI